MIIGFTIILMLAAGYAYLSEGLFSACVMCVNVVLAGLVAFNFWEPLADTFEGVVSGMFLVDYLDLICMVGIFSLVLGLLRMASYNLAPSMVEYHGYVQSIGGAAVGMVTGYLIAGFLVCAMQTLPWHEEFMFFSPRSDPTNGLRHVMPPDRVWLGMMTRAGAYSLANDEDSGVEPIDQFPDAQIKTYLTFDKYSTFEARYARYRRYTNKRNAMPYSGELAKQLHRLPPQPGQAGKKK